jgi:hypothetical protein
MTSKSTYTSPEAVSHCQIEQRQQIKRACVRRMSGFRRNIARKNRIPPKTDGDINLGVQRWTQGISAIVESATQRLSSMKRVKARPSLRGKSQAAASMARFVFPMAGRRLRLGADHMETLGMLVLADW